MAGLDTQPLLQFFLIADICNLKTAFEFTLGSTWQHPLLSRASQLACCS
jgi:hypothetical protein